MSSIDERVVNMKFDNGQFKNGIDSTLKGLDSLKKGLDLSASTKSLDNLNAAGSRFSLAGIANGIQGLSGKFSALSVTAVTALATIASKATSVGLQLVKSLTIDPIIGGLREYETNLNSVQTILANTQVSGATLKDVNSALDELNHYSDQTIYNFSEMAKNIGTFTAAGVDLKTSTESIKGIANIAALSGSNSQQAAGAMYQLSQAISSGRVSLEDWNSVVNAGMGGTTFQRALAETAVAMGKLDAGSLKLSGSMKNVTIDGESFRNSISATGGKASWLTSDVLTNTLKQFTGDMKDAELAAMGFNAQQIKDIQAMAKTALQSATEYKTLSAVIDGAREVAGSGWAETWRIVFGDFEEAKKLWTQVGNIVGNFIGKMGDARNKMLTDWKKLGGRNSAIAAVGNVFKALVKFIEPIKKAFQDIFPPVTGKNLTDITKKIQKFTEALIPTQGTMNAIGRIFKGVFAAIDIGRMILVEAIKMIGRLFGGMDTGRWKLMLLTANFGDWLVALRDGIKKGKGLTDFFKGLERILAVPIKMFKTLAGIIGDFFSSLSKGSGEVKNAGDRFAWLKDVGEGLAKVWSKIVEGIKKLWEALGPVGEFFANIGRQLLDGFKNLDFDQVLGIINTGLFAGLVLLFKNFLGGGWLDQIKEAFGGGDGDGFFATIKETFGGLTDTLQAMQTKLKADALVKLAVALAILAVSMLLMSSIDTGRLVTATSGMAIMFTQLLVGLAILEKISTFGGAFKLGPIATGLILLSTAILILTAAVKNLSGLDWQELAKGLVGVGGLLGSLILFTKFAQANKGGLLSSAGLVLLGIAINILADAVAKFGVMDWQTIGKGLTVLGAIFAMLAVFIKVVNGAKGIFAASIAMTLLGDTLKKLSEAIGQLGKLSWEQIGKGLVAMAGALVAIAGAIALLPVHTVVIAGGMIVMALALGMIAKVMKQMGGFSWEEIGKSLVMLAGSLIIIAGALYLMTGTLPGALALIIVAGALAVMAPVLDMFGKMSWDDIGRGLTMLAGVLGVIALGGILLIAALPGLLGLGTAVLLFGVGAALAGVGITAFAAGLTALAAAAAVGGAAITTVLKGIGDAIPYLAVKFAEGMVKFATVIATGGPEILKAFITVLSSLVDAVIAISPKIAKMIQLLIDILVNLLVVNIPKFVDAGFKILIGFLRGIANNIQKVIDEGARVIINFLTGLGKNAKGIADAGTNTIVKFLNAVGSRENAKKLTDAGFDAVINVIKGVTDSVNTKSGELRTAGGELAFAIVDGMTGGMASKARDIAASAWELGSKAIAAIKGAIDSNSPSKETYKLGSYVGDGFYMAIDDSGRRVSRAASAMGTTAITSLKSSLSGISKAVSSEMAVDPVIRPVLDLSAVRRDAGTITGLLTPSRIEVNDSLAKASTIALQNRSGETVISKAETEPATGTVNNIFNQTNNSPKALSREEIYRDTNNLMSKIKKGSNK